MTIESQTASQPSLAKLVTMYQAMQTVLSHPPSEELTKIVTSTLERTTDPLMISFLNLLITGDQTHRDMAARIYQGLEERIVKARQQHVQASVDAALAVPVPTVAAEVTTLPSPTEERDIISASAVLQPQGLAASPTPVPAVPVIVPWDIPDTEHYELRYSDAQGAVTKTETYSIVTETLALPDSPLDLFHQIKGVIIGIQGQTSIEHGFGFVLPLDGIDFQPADKSVHIPMRLEYPSAMPVYDDHNVTNVPGLKEFLALHGCMAAGYTVCLDLYVKVNAHPDRGHSLSLTLRREKLLLRRAIVENGHYGQDGAMFSSQDLEDLHSATKKLAFVGLLASTLHV